VACPLNGEVTFLREELSIVDDATGCALILFSVVDTDISEPIPMHSICFLLNTSRSGPLVFVVLLYWLI